MPQDYYDTLGVSKSASSDEIRQAWKKLARQYHPDVKPDNAQAAEKFKQIQEAWGVLGDAQKRAQYDRFGHAFQGGGPGGGFHRSSEDSGSVDIDLGDILGNMFGGSVSPGGAGGGFGFGGGRRARAAPQKGQNIRTEFQIPFLVAVEGGEHELRVTRGGTNETLSIRIPPGVDSGSVIRLAGQGHAGQHGGAHGDLLVSVRPASHPWFRRDGANLTVEVPVTLGEAALGARIEVPTLSDGPVMLTIPPGTSGGTRLRLRGKGVIDQKSGTRGDQYVAVKIEVPTDLSDRAKSLFEELREAAPQSPRDNLW